jgi:hypothetical protein
MKVVCNINTKIFNFTEGKIYEVITGPHDYFFAKYVIDDKGYKIKYSEYTEYMFKPLESIRQDKIDQLIK